MKEFDLNIEKILESWDVYHAIREIIANAIDEQIITNTQDIQIKKTDDNCWHIIDFGRGLNYHHLTQNENEEKINNEKLIGQFGVGLKDALATLYRHHISVVITSKFGRITLQQSAKSGFEDIITLHAIINDSPNPNMIGTDFCLNGCSDLDIEKAKSLFLKFSNEKVLESTVYGEVIERKQDYSNIYINGVKVAEEDNFLFSYNITSLTTQIKKALNRERSNVGRTAYTPRIKDILKKCTSQTVITKLANDINQFHTGLKHGELEWNDIALHASIELSKINKNSTYVTASEISNQPSMLDEIKKSGYNPVVVPETLLSKMTEYNKSADNGDVLRTTQVYAKEEEKKFVPTPIDLEQLTEKELSVYNQKERILSLIGGKPINVKEIILVETLYDSSLFRGNTVGLWKPDTNQILIKRSQLSSVSSFAGTLLHECAHAISHAHDVSREFEEKLTDFVGKATEQYLKLYDVLFG